MEHGAGKIGAVTTRNTAHDTVHGAGREDLVAEPASTSFWRITGTAHHDPSNYGSLAPRLTRFFILYLLMCHSAQPASIHACILRNAIGY